MRKVIAYIAMSLDGYIADENGAVDWLAGDGSDQDNPGSFPRFMQTIDTVILGYTTYHQIATELFPDGWIYSGKTSYVLTHRHIKSTDEIIFTNENMVHLIEKLRVQEGKDIWICGGAHIINQFIDFHLIDRYHITIIPIVLGSGIRLFSSHDTSQLLQFVSTESYNGMVDLVYEVRQDDLPDDRRENNA